MDEKSDEKNECACVYYQWNKKKNTTPTNGQKYQLFPIAFDPNRRKTPNKVFLVLIKLLSDPEVNHSVRRDNLSAKRKVRL